MVKRKIMLFLAILMSCFCVVLFEKISHAETYSPNAYIQEIIQNQSEYECWENANVQFSTDLYGDEINCKIYDILSSNDVPIGYIILDYDNKLLEYSQNVNPYDMAKEKYGLRGLCGYNNGTYEIMYNSEIYYFDVTGCLIDKTQAEGNSGYATYGYVSGKITPQLQNKDNCIVTAISNMIWYYGENGYSSLIKNKSFSDIKSSVDKTMTNLGGYKNKYIPKTFKKCIGKKYKKAKGKNSPQFSDVKKEIDSDRPCLLGFAKGSSYSKKVGHMTCCVGYHRISSDYYVCVLDGHSDKTVMKVWSKYNDYMCTLKLK